MFKRKLKDRLKPTDLYTIVSMWLVAMGTIFLLIGANSRGILWVFLLGGFMSWWLLTRKK